MALISIADYIQIQKEIAEKHRTMYSGSFANIRRIAYMCKYGENYSKYLQDNDAEIESILDQNVVKLFLKQLPYREPTNGLSRTPTEPLIGTVIPPLLTTQGTELFYPPNTSKYFAKDQPKVTSPTNPSESKAVSISHESNTRADVHPTIAFHSRRKPNTKQPPGSIEKPALRGSTTKKEPPKKRKVKETVQDDSSSCNEVIPDVELDDDMTVDYSQSKVQKLAEKAELIVK